MIILSLHFGLLLLKLFCIGYTEKALLKHILKLSSCVHHHYTCMRSKSVAIAGEDRFAPKVDGGNVLEVRHVSADWFVTVIASHCRLFTSTIWGAESKAFLNILSAVYPTNPKYLCGQHSIRNGFESWLPYLEFVGPSSFDMQTRGPVSRQTRCYGPERKGDVK